MKKTISVLTFLFLLFFFVSGCGSIPFQKTEEFKPRGHVSIDHNKSDDIPPVVTRSISLPQPKASQKQPLFTVVVQDVAVKDLLFSLVRDANMNLDIQSDVEGKITINAVDQTLSAILDRIVTNTDLHYDIHNGTVRVRKDTPYFKNYRIDYLNISRNSKGNVRVSTQISATGAGASAEGGGGEGDNNSGTEVSNVSNNDFWNTLEKNVAAILGDGQVSTAEQSQGSSNIYLNREAGIMGVRANNKYHKQVAEFLSEIMASTRRQVLIEATIAEVTLNKSHQTGVNWSLIDDGVGSGVSASQSVTDVGLNASPNLAVTIFEQFGDGDALLTTLRALEQFGDVSVMSSPKVMAMNNQTALLKVVDNLVYFTVEISVEPATDTSPRLTTFETQINTVPVGFVMSVTPFISEHNVVTLNVRPTISRVIDQRRDPNPDLADSNVINEIPVIQVREVESLLKVNSGEVAVIGGLMQDEIEERSSGVPLISNIPGIGRLFKYDEKRKVKTELVIFLKPRVIENASVAKDMQDFQRFLPSQF